MSTSVSWRGRLADPARIDELENALLEYALEFGGHFRPFDPEDGLRGGLLDLAPGLGRVPLGVARDGSLAGAPSKDGWISADVAHASPEGRALVVEVLERLREEFCPGLEIVGDAGKRDPAVHRRVRGASGRRESRRPQIGANDPEGIDQRAEGTEEEWEAFHRRNKRRDAGIMRAMSHMNEGESKEPLLDAMKAEGIIGLDDEKHPFAVEQPDEPADDEPDDPPAPREFRMPPLVRRALDLVCQVHKAGKSRPYDPLTPDSILSAWVLELSGGLSQAIQSREDEDEDPTPFGLAVVQLKRALRGVEFCLGAIPACREAGRIKPAALKKIEDALKSFDAEIRKRLGETRTSWARARRSLQ